MKKLIILLTLLSHSALAKTYPVYDPMQGRTVYVTNFGVHNDYYRPVKASNSTYHDTMPTFHSLPAMGNLGFDAYSEPYDYEE